MNWNGTTDHVFTLAHEAGHAMHSHLAMRTQPYHYSGYTIFTAEIASTINEVFLTWDLLETTPEDDFQERFAILNRFADGIWGTLARQTMFAEFEHRTHQLVESGQPLTKESLGALYGELSEVYRPGVVNDSPAQLEWSRVPHFYRAFYVFQYATGISAAVSLATNIREGGEPERDRYLEMLSAGGSDYPIALLQHAGVDLTTPQPVEATLKVFEDTIAQMEDLATRGGFYQ